MPLQWSEERKPNSDCSYDHAVAASPLGELRIERKGWKDYPAPTCILPWGEFVQGNDLDDAKQDVQVAWDAMVQAVALLSSGVKSR